MFTKQRNSQEYDTQAASIIFDFSEALKLDRSDSNEIAFEKKNSSPST